MAVEKRKQPLGFSLLCVIAKEQIPEPLDYGEWAERIKTRLARLRLPCPDLPTQLTAAMDAVARSLGRQHELPPHVATPIIEAGPAPPLTHTEAVRVLEHLGARGHVKRMPAVRAMTVRQAECQKAAKILAQGILEQIARCEDAERAVEQPETKA